MSDHLLSEVSQDQNQDTMMTPTFTIQWTKAVETKYLLIKDQELSNLQTHLCASLHLCIPAKTTKLLKKQSKAQKIWVKVNKVITI